MMGGVNKAYVVGRAMLAGSTGSCRLSTWSVHSTIQSSQGISEAVNAHGISEAVKAHGRLVIKTTIHLCVPGGGY